MNLKKIKEILKNRKVQIITGTVVGVLALTVAGTIILNNKNVENKNIIVEKDDKRVSNEENIEIKEQLEELKSIDTSNMSDEEKKELENKIADTEKKVANNNNDDAGKEVTSNTSTSKPNSTSTTIENSSTSTNTNKGSNSNSKPSSGSSSNSNSSNNTGGSSTSGSTGGNTSNKEESHTHNWVPITSVLHHDEQGHNEKVLVSEAWTEEVPIYEEQYRAICNTCGEDITSNYAEHIKQHMLNGEGGSYRNEVVQIQVGTNKINHDAVYEDKWIVDKAAWDETVTTGYKCSSCGATK